MITFLPFPFIADSPEVSIQILPKVVVKAVLHESRFLSHLLGIGCGRSPLSCAPVVFTSSGIAAVRVVVPDVLAACIPSDSALAVPKPNA